MGAKPPAGVRYQASATSAPKPKPERKKVSEARSRSKYAGAQNRKEDEAALAKKKLLGE